jgi:hypothetical protein
MPITARHQRRIGLKLAFDGLGFLPLVFPDRFSWAILCADVLRTLRGHCFMQEGNIGMSHTNTELYWWLAVNGASCAASNCALPISAEVIPTPEQMIGFQTQAEQQRTQRLFLNAPLHKVKAFFKTTLPKRVKRGEVMVVYPPHPQTPTTGPTLWIYSVDEVKPDITVTIAPLMREHPLLKICLDRSKQKFQAGLRTRKKDCKVWPLTHAGKELSGEFLVSTYFGGTIGVITTPTSQWVGMIEEMDQGAELAGNHAEIARPFVAEVKVHDPEMN